MSLFECDRDDCTWENPNFHWGLADAGAAWASHMSAHDREDEAVEHGP